MGENGSSLQKESTTPNRVSADGTDLSEADLTELQYLLSHLNADNAANMILKGHLVVEEKVSEALEASVFRPEYLERARLTFAQKLFICRSSMLVRGDNQIWELIANLNSLRNALSHSLNGNRRAEAMKTLVATYTRVCDGNIPTGEQASESLLLTCILATCIGFMSSVKKEISQIKARAHDSASHDVSQS